MCMLSEVDFGPGFTCCVIVTEKRMHKKPKAMYFRQGEQQRQKVYSLDRYGQGSDWNLK